MSCIYLLHFEEPLSHAQHYLGSTTDLEERVRRHRAGQGARLTQVLHERSRAWKLAAVFMPHSPTASVRGLERAAKQRHGAAAYCPICARGNQIAPKGTYQVPVPKEIA
jgi:predicted GIY-YIG superfamily endonuclease